MNSLRNDPPSRRQKGYTLIELLLYISVLGIVLSGISVFFGTSIEARVKNRTISEVDEQGTLVMEQLTRIVRNATSISSPAAGASGNTLTLAVPTAPLSPTIISVNDTGGGGGGTVIMGYNVDGTGNDSDDSNHINATKFVASASGTVTKLFARVGSTLGTSPNNKAQMAIYSGTSSPSTLLATSPDVVLTASSWNTFTISPVSVTTGTTYWLAYNTNGTTTSQNLLRVHTGTTNQSAFVVQTYGTWPGSWTGTSQSSEFSMYAEITTGTGIGPLQIKEGSNANVEVTNSRVQVSGLTFTNLTRSGTTGIVRINFTVSAINAPGKNEYEYQKTFTSTAAVRP